MKWLPARAYGNAVYAVFSNAIGMDEDQLKNGYSMIIDPFGGIITACRKLDNDIAIATLKADKLLKAGGYRFKMARRSEFYRDIIGQSHTSQLKASWMNAGKE